MTLLSNLQNAGLPISTATEDGNQITWQSPPTDTQMQSCRDIVLQYVDLPAYNVYTATQTDKAQLRAEYIATIQTLTDIENAVSPTNAQVIAAVKFLAKTLRLLIKLIARSI